jgi:endo-1,4-beta-D-glucanase Y
MSSPAIAGRLFAVDPQRQQKAAGSAFSSIALRLLMYVARAVDVKGWKVKCE